MDDLISTSTKIIRDKIFQAEALGKLLPLADLANLDKTEELSQFELKTEHFFSPGIYTRILYIPKGLVLTGHIHKEPILNIMVKGDITVFLGDEPKRIVAPFICVSPAGSKKIGFTHEDTIWIGCHDTDELDISKIEERFIAKSEEEWIEYVNQQLRLPL